MTVFVAKYAEVEAVLFDGENVNEVLQFGGPNVSDSASTGESAVYVQTNNGEVELHPGHWLVKGVSDFYPCDPQTFAARWAERKPVAAEYRANPAARANAIQYLGVDNLDAVLDFGHDKIELGEDGILRVETNSGSQILDKKMWLLDGPSGLFVSDPVAFMLRWINDSEE